MPRRTGSHAVPGLDLRCAGRGRQWRVVVLDGRVYQVQGIGAPIMKRAFDTQGPVIVGVHVDYRDNHELFEMLHEDSIH